MHDELAIKEYFSREVKTRMEELNLRPYHMSYFCQIKHNSVYGYLNGTLLPNPFSLVLMAEHLECCTDELLGYEPCADDDVFEPFRASKMFANRKEYAHCLGDRLRGYMVNHDITPDELARMADISVEVIKRWTSERPTLPRMNELLKVIDALDCKPSELLGY